MSNRRLLAELRSYATRKGKDQLQRAGSKPQPLCLHLTNVSRRATAFAIEPDLVNGNYLLADVGELAGNVSENTQGFSH